MTASHPLHVPNNVTLIHSMCLRDVLLLVLLALLETSAACQRGKSGVGGMEAFDGAHAGPALFQTDLISTL